MLGGVVTGITLVFAENVKFIAFTFQPSHVDFTGAPDEPPRRDSRCGGDIVPVAPPAP
jgi:hypothetical protein